MGRFYIARFEAIVVSALQDLFFVQGPTDAITIIHSWELFQITDVGDAEEEILPIETVRGVGTINVPTGGAAITPEPVLNGDPAYGGTVRRNDTTRMSAGIGAIEDLELFGWNVRIPRPEVWVPEPRPPLAPGDSWTLSLPTAPGDAITSYGKLILEEIG